MTHEHKKEGSELNKQQQHKELDQEITIFCREIPNLRLLYTCDAPFFRRNRQDKETL